MSESKKRGSGEVRNESYISATGRVGLEFDNVEPLRNLIDRITDDLNPKVLMNLEDVESCLKKLRFSKLSLQDELDQCRNSIHRQNRSLKEFKSQFEKYVNKVKDTEASIIEQLGTIVCDYDTSTNSAALDTVNVNTEIQCVKLSVTTEPEEVDDGTLFDGLKDFFNEIAEAAEEAAKTTTEVASTALEDLGEFLEDSGLSEPFKEFEKLFEYRREVIEQIGVPQVNIFGKIVDIIETYQGKREEIGSYIEGLNVFAISDFVGAYTGTRTDDQSNIFSILGSYAKGMRIEGFEETAKALLETAGDPFGTLENLNKMLAYPKESTQALKESLNEFTNKKIVNGTADDKSTFAGQLLFEAITWVVSASEAKAASNASKLATKEEKIVEKLDDIAEEARKAKIGSVSSKGGIDTIDGFKVIDGKININGKTISVEDYQKIRSFSIKNADSDTMTLGKFEVKLVDGQKVAGPNSYTTKAGDTTYFDLGNDWGKIEKKYNLDDSEMFELFNKPALDDAVASGKAIRFSHNPNKYGDCALKEEWEYLKKKYGYIKLKKIGDYWYAE